MAKFRGFQAFAVYRATGLSTFESGVGERFDKAEFKRTGVAEYGCGLKSEHQVAFRAAVVSEGEALLARHEADKEARSQTARAVSRVATNSEVAEALASRVAALSGLRAHDAALINEAARRLRGAR